MSEDKSTSETPTTAVIFQAPEPAKPRRASAPAGPPKTADAPASDAAGSSSGGGNKGGSGQSAKASGSDKNDDSKSSSKASAGAKGDSSGNDSGGNGPDDADSGEGGAKRRRRRGGRGRGKKRSEGESSDGASDSDGADGSSSSEGSDSSDSKSGNGKTNGAKGDSKSDSNKDSDSASGNGSDSSDDHSSDDDSDGDSDGSSSSRRRRRRRGSRSSGSSVSSSSSGSGSADDQLQGSTRLQAKRQRRRDNRDGQRRRPVISEAEFLARRESVKRDMIVREKDHRVQIAVLEDDVLVEHYVSHQAQQSMAGNVYLGRVQNVLPGMEAAFVDVGRGRNAVLYAGEVNWDAAGMEGKPRRIELALKPGDTVMVQVTKDPIGHKGARVTSQISLAGRFLVYVPAGGVTGISRKLPDTERARLKKLLREVIPADAGVIVRTAAEGASEEELRADVERLKRQWEGIKAEAETGKAPTLLRGEPDMAIRVVRDIFNEDFESLTIQGDDTWNSLSAYVGQVAPDLMPRLHKFAGKTDVFEEHRVDEMLAKGMDRKVWLPSGGSLVIDRTEAMTVIDVNTGKFVGKGGTLEETMTLNNLEAAEEIVRQLRLRDIGGIIVIDFVDMLLEGNRDRVLRRLIECLGRDRTKHQVAEVTSLGLVQMTRKRVGQGLVEAFSETCEHCKGRGFLVHGEPVAEVSEKQPERRRGGRGSGQNSGNNGSGSGRGSKKQNQDSQPAAEAKTEAQVLDDREEAREAVKATLASIAAAAEKAHQQEAEAAENADAKGAKAPQDAEPAKPADMAADVVAEPAVAPAGEAQDEIDTTAGEPSTEEPAKQDNA